MSGYFDYNSTAPLLPVAREAWVKANDTSWHNASGLYREGGEVHRKLEDARGRLGEILGCDGERIVFTSGATESNNALFQAAVRRVGLGKIIPEDIVGELVRSGIFRNEHEFWSKVEEDLGAPRQVVAGEVEHPSVREPVRACFGKRVRLIPTQPSGVARVQELDAMLATAGPALVTLMAANNECGTLQPWREALKICRANGVPFHTDASQWIGKLPSGELGGCDYVTGSGHKFGGPKGIGFLVMREEGEALHFLEGGPQEEGRRAGTENYPAIEAMVTALEWLTPRLEEIREQQAPLRDRFIDRLRAKLRGVRIIGEGAECLWNTVMFVAPQGDNRKWCARLSQAGYQVSTGSACSALKDGSSVVLAALGATAEETQRVIRVSGGWGSTPEDWESLADAISNVKL